MIINNLDMIIVGVCYCGCGERVEKKWKRGHVARVNHPMFGKHHTEETKKKCREKHLGKHHSPETEFKKGCKINLGRRATEKTKKILSESHIGVQALEKHPNWKGGISFEPYCKKFNKQLKENIRKRNKHICQLCGKTELENGRKLDVHHIHYDKPNCNPDLIALCHNCNIRVSFNRNYWEEYFESTLRNKKIL